MWIFSLFSQHHDLYEVFTRFGMQAAWSVLLLFLWKIACEAALGPFLQETNLLKGQVMLYLNLHPLPLHGARSNKLRVTVHSHFTCCTSTWAQSPFYTPQSLLLLKPPSQFLLFRFFSFQTFSTRAMPSWFLPSV